ncbi:MAG TPA: hypothetical protein DCM08_06015 [Microscillaceae bacterium]|jgi:glycosyltransferase involved in cell wall biosynthesis|nr:hypothetical protein [Microscillaceae bacterium]
MTYTKPLVTVICLCYNHANYLEEALTSIFDQTYPSLEMIWVDDASTDQSVAIMQKVLASCPQELRSKIKATLWLPTNQGNCKAFNKALAMAAGKYVIDFATDDKLLPHHIAAMVQAFETLPESYALLYANAYLMNDRGKIYQCYYQVDKHQKAKPPPPSGQVYVPLLAQSWICAPTTVFRKQALQTIGGYPEHFSFEDWPTWLALAKNHQFQYIDQIGVIYRQTTGSKTQRMYALPPNQHLQDCLQICQDIVSEQLSEPEKQAFWHRLRYFVRLSFYTHHFALAAAFGSLLKKINGLNLTTNIWLWLASRQVKVNRLYRFYSYLRYTITPFLVKLFRCKTHEYKSAH